MAGRQDAFSIPGPADVEKALIRAINKERRAAGVGELRVSPDLAAAARDHSRAMAAASVLSHTSPDGRSPTLRLVLAGIFFAASGENVASSTGFSAALIHRALMESPEHRSNILDPEFDMAGIGVAGKWPRTAYVTQDFIRSLPVVPEAVAAERTKRRVNALRLKNGLRPLVFWPEADAFAKRLSIVDSIGASRPSFPERFGEIQSLLASGPEPFDTEMLSVAILQAEYSHAGLAISFARTSAHPGGAYFSALLLASETRYDKPGADLAAAVRDGLNARRIERGLAPLAMKEGANEVARRELAHTGTLRTLWPGLENLPSVYDGVSYRTFRPDVLPDNVLALLFREDLAYIGIAAAFDKPPEFPRGVLRVVLALPPGSRRD